MSNSLDIIRVLTVVGGAGALAAGANVVYRYTRLPEDSRMFDNKDAWLVSGSVMALMFSTGAHVIDNLGGEEFNWYATPLFLLAVTLLWVFCVRASGHMRSLEQRNGYDGWRAQDG